MSLKGKTLFITGGSRGLGLQMAHALGEAGARIMLSSRKADDLEQATAQLQAAGINARWIAADCAREDDIQRLFMDGINLFGAYFSAQNLRLDNVIAALQSGFIPYIHRLHPPKN